MASFNIGQTPMPTNAGVKPFIKPVAVGSFANTSDINYTTSVEDSTTGASPDQFFSHVSGGSTPGGTGPIDATGVSPTNIVTLGGTAVATNAITTTYTDTAVSGTVTTTETTVVTANYLAVGVDPTSGATLLPSTTASSDEGKRVYAVFKFNDSATGTTLTELRDNAALTYSFDGISADDWVAGSFKVATLGSTGLIVSDAASDYRDAAYATGTVASSGWANVSTDANATSGTIYYKDLTALDPLNGTGVYGVVLSVELKNDALPETGEFVKFKITQDSASGTVFTQSNYTEATIKVTDGVGAFTATIDDAALEMQNTGFVVTSDGITATAAVNPVANGVVYNGTDNITNKFAIGSNTTFAQSKWNLTGVDFLTIGNFDAVGPFGFEDVLSINFSGSASTPGLSLVNFGDVTAAFASESSLLNGLRSLDGFSMNNSGVYMMQQGTNTYILVDTNRNGTVDTGATTTPATNDTDLLIKLTGVTVTDMQSTNFQLVA